MKRLFIATFLPLLLSQSVAIAQTAPQQPAQPEKPAVSQAETAVNQQLPIVPLKGTDQIQLQVVNCNWVVDCLLANLFLPASTRLNQIELQLDNPALVPTKILNSAVSVQGALTHYPLPSSALSISPGDIAFPTQTITSVPLTLNRSAMPPEQYVGAIYLTQANQSNRLILPINLSVRSGPFLPLLVLLVGVILGRLFKYMQEQGGPQSQARKKVYQLEADIREAHPADRKILLPMLRDTRKLVYRQQLEAADTQVTLIQSRLRLLNQLRAIEDQLYEKQKRSESVEQETLDQIQQIQDARVLIAQGKDDEATTTLTEILKTASTEGRRGAADDSDADSDAMIVALRGAAITLDQSARNAITEAEKTAALTPIERLEQFLVAVSGLSDQVRAEATFWFVRPLLYLVLLTGLTLAGLNTLYIEKGETFGAKPTSDYLTLLLWGLSADVASRSLSGLQGQKE